MLLGTLSIATQLQGTLADVGSDESLAALGDVDGFIQLYRKHLNPVYSYLYARLGSREEAEDVTAITFERALSSIKGYKPTGSFAGWLFTIAHRSLADHYRQRKVKQVSVDAYTDMLFDPAQGPEDQAVMSDHLHQVLRVISEMSRDQQEIIGLRFIADLKYSEIAQITGKREAAVKMTAYRALEEIRRRCEDVL